MALFGSGNSQNVPNDGIESEQRMDILSSLNIQPTVKIPDEILVPRDLTGVRLTISEPRGYHPVEVEQMFQKVMKSIQWYENALKKRNEEIVTLGNSGNMLQTDLANEKNKNIWLQTHNTQSNMYDPAVVAQLQDSLARKDAELQELRNQNLGSSITAGERKELEELRAWSEEVKKQYADLEAQYDSITVENESLHTMIRALKSQTSADPAPSTDVEPGLPVASEEVEQRIEELSEKNAQLEAYTQSLLEHISSLDAYIDSLESGTANVTVEEPVTEYEASLVEEQEPQEEHSYESHREVLVNPYENTQQEQSYSQLLPEENVQEEADYDLYAPAVPEQHYDMSVESYDDTSLIDDDIEDIDLDDIPDSNEGNVIENIDDIFSDFEEEVPETLSSPEPTPPTPPTPQAPVVDEEPGDLFARMQRELREDMESDAPEVGAGIKRPNSPFEKREKIVPGAPLKSIPQGADPNDYL